MIATASNLVNLIYRLDVIKVGNRRYRRKKHFIRGKVERERSCSRREMKSRVMNTPREMCSH